ncbi:uncharacterized protein M421DRAFT_4202 [Didymella exigua CBS 183.55]|uniref:Uncharacterized protein n=1 Tax=Didymella exigua CBS 183.55 TaxID=1150837 RepID=A0A6A5RMW0_9PLEO|nr:uncharacterized protein M421DRAFT_4202 [Didymella exigua CBS 183.55]KAF1929761.1 hypothetical protein M421DRAFT_4202 [Didymella exigua CBS 183.55]
MQNYGRPAYDRPGSTMSFAGQQPPPVPSYQQQQQWSQQPPQQHQSAPGYNPGTYGAMAGDYGQGAQYPPTSQPSDPYAQQPHSDIPPPPPPKPYGFATAVQQQNEHHVQYAQNTQSAQKWQQPQQASTGFAPQAQQGGYPVYSNAGPPPSSATTVGSYYPQSQDGRPGSIYGADQVGASASLVHQQPGSTVMSSNEQDPAYKPSSLSGQGVQAYITSNLNPMPGVYVPPSPDVPAWQQAQHAPLQGGNKRFTYTKSTVDPSFYAQGYQGVQPAQQQQQPPPLPPRLDQGGVSQQQTQQYGQQPPQYHLQTHVHPQQPQQPPPLHDQITQQQQQPQVPAHFGQVGQPVQPLQQQWGQHSPVPQSYMQQQAAQLEQYAQMHQQQQSQHQVQSPAQSQPQWQAPAPAQNNYAQQKHQEPPPAMHGYQQQDQQYHQQQPQEQQYQRQPQQPQEQQYQRQPQQTQQQSQQLPQASMGQQYYPALEQNIGAPNPFDRTDTTPPGLVHQSSPHNHYVSPAVSHCVSSFTLGRPVSVSTDSVSSIALVNIHSQRAANRTASPKSPPFNPAPPPPRDDVSRFSALGTGGPSDWETFGAGDEIDDEAIFARKPRPVQLDSVELPAPHQPSPPLTQDWPSPANTAPISQSGRRDTYQPTPPTTTISPVHIHRTPSPKTPQQHSFANNALVAPLRASPQQVQTYEAPQDARHGFVMGEVLWGEPDSPRQLHNASQRAQLEGLGAPSTGSQGEQVSVPAQTPATYAMAPFVETSLQKRPGASRFFSDVGTTWGLSPKDKEQQSSPWVSRDDSNLPAKLQAKDEELWRLRRESKDEMQRVQAEIEAGKAEFLAEIDRLKADEEAARTLTGQQSAQLNQQVETMKAAAKKAKTDADALKKENDLTIERIKEDIEGKEDTIKDQDETIVDLRKQRDDLRQQLDDAHRQLEIAHTQFDNAQRQLKEEKTKAVPEPPKPSALDLVPDLDPWYAGSLERYIDMLRGEANELQVEDKIKTFQTFLKAESTIRGIEYYDAPPATSVTEHSQVAQSGGLQSEKRDLSIAVPQDLPDDDDYDYSPGGRPLLKRPTALAEVIIPTHASGIASSQSTAILTPASSVHDDSTPIQSPPEEQPQPLYKAYVPPILSTDVLSSLAQRHATGPSALANTISPIGPGKNRDEIFFGAQKPNGPRAGHKSTLSDDTGGVPIVAPLNLASSRPVSVGAAPNGNALDTLKSLLPDQLRPDPFRPPTPSSDLNGFRKKAAGIKTNSKNIEELTKSWEKSTSLTRKKNDDARRERQEESEENNDDLFNSDEISYAELKDLEAEQRSKENNLTIQEAQAEVKSYVETVFDKVYNDLQEDIAKLTDLYIEAETLLQTSVSGVRSLGDGHAPSTKACLEILIELHEQMESTHEQIVQAIAERDKRYKKTEVQPAYNAGDKAKLKTMEKHFEQAEKRAVSRAKNEKAERLGEVVKTAEEAIVGAARIEQSERSRIIAAVRDLEDGDNADVLKRTHETLNLLHDSSKLLLAIFNRLEISLNIAEVDADVAQALVDSAPESKVKEMQSEMTAREAQLKEEFVRRIGVLDQDREEFEQLIKDRGGSVERSGEQEKEERLKAALEEAKRRNGHA